jgi:ABC-type dipeptide/oligopeptide/nickel transport system permease subunit
MDTAERAERPDQLIGTLPPQQMEGYEAQEQGSVSPTRAAFRRFLHDKRAIISLGIVIFIVLGSFIFPLIYQHLGPTLPPSQNGASPVPPSDYHSPNFASFTGAFSTDAPGSLLPLGPNSIIHPFGTDGLGRDMLARLMAGTQVSFELAMLVEVLDISIGILLGTLAGWYGGWIGNVLDRFTDVVFAFPALLLIILMGASLGPIFDEHFPPSISRILMLTLALGLLAWPLMMRQVRGLTLQLKEQQFTEAARTVGTSDRRIIISHIVPNLTNIVIIIASLDILATIIGESGISLLGFGIQEPNSSLGLMISDGVPQLYGTWTELFWPVAVLVILVITFSFIGDGARDAFDPRTKD